MRQQGIKLVMRLLVDGSRRDRYVRRADDGHYYSSPDRTFLTSEGPETPPYVEVPVCDEDISEDDLETEASALLDALDNLID